MAQNPVHGSFTMWRRLPVLLLIAGLIGFSASMALTIETIKVYQDPLYQPLCSLNPILSCQSIMSTSQASVLGFTNSLLGIGAFAALVAFAAALLAGAKFKPWLWRCLLLAAGIGVVFMHWLAYQSLYVIGSLCPYCLVVWAVTIPTFWYLLLHNLRAGFIGKNLPHNSSVRFISTHHIDGLLIWYLVIILLVVIRFWYYFSSLV